MFEKALIIISLVTHFIDQALDALVAFVYVLEGRIMASAFAVAFIMAPGIFIAAVEMRKACKGQSNICKAIAYGLFSPLWALIVHFYGLFDKDYVRTAFYFKTVEGFLEAAPQLVLQLSLFLLGRTSDSAQLALDLKAVSNATDLELFGRNYAPSTLALFGALHVASVAMSFFSVLASAVTFNELEERSEACSKHALARCSVSVPFFVSTLLFRALGVSLLVVFLRYWAGVVVFALFFLNFLSAVAIGDAFYRGLSYALWSVLVPVGFNRDPEAPLGYKKVPAMALMASSATSTPEGRAKYFLTSHVIGSIAILGTSVLYTLISVQIHPEDFMTRPPFDLGLLNTLFLPLLGLCLGLSVFFARPYHRCECSGGEAPKGNIIV